MNALYHRIIRAVGLKRTITYYLRRWQNREPLVWLILAAIVGLTLGRWGSLNGLLWAGPSFTLGLILGHLLWAGGRNGDKNTV